MYLSSKASSDPKLTLTVKHGDTATHTLQQGFTLLELIIAITIFAVLAVAGWQVFDSLNKSKVRSEAQIETLSQVQYAYQQMQRDMMQVVAYNLPSTGGDDINSNEQGSVQQNSFQLNNNVLSFVRYADPDPRYQEVATLERIEYRFSEGALLRRRFSDVAVQNNANGVGNVPFDSQILTDIEGGSIQVLMPEPSIVFPDEDALANKQVALHQAMTDKDANAAASKPSIPKGVAISFKIQMGNQSIPLQWRFALPATPPEVSIANPL